MLAGEGLQPTSKGARIKFSDGKTTVIDGPFTESKEVVGGFAILDAPSKEVAVEYVKEFLKATGTGECEVRQLYDANCMPEGVEEPCVVRAAS